MEIETNLEEYKNELNEIVRLFFPTFQNNECHSISHTYSNNKNTIIIDDKEYSFPANETEIKSDAKIALYDALSKHFDKQFEWGALTGVRPTKLAYDLVAKGVPEYLLKETLIKKYRLSETKAKLIKDTISNQKCIIRNDNLVDIFINIPICPSRCRYCSFISSEYDKVKDKVPTYVETVLKELSFTKRLIQEKSLVVRSIYIGGGTPSVLSAEQLDEILSQLAYPSAEFTVEAGRPDTITKEKLEVFKKNNVTRICINPQTFCEKTLKAIGRKHTVKDIISAYSMALEYGFDINLDLIAGLPGEKFATFKKSINNAIEMYPANITVHTLALKRGSNLTNDAMNKVELSADMESASELEVKKMIDFAHSRLEEEGYKPYYLYRQKNTPLGLENVGFTQKGHACIFNIDSMEETCSVLACGANAISKRVFHIDNRIERCANVKFIEDYISRVDEMIERKKELFK